MPVGMVAIGGTPEAGGRNVGGELCGRAKNTRSGTNCRGPLPQNGQYAVTLSDIALTTLLCCSGENGIQTAYHGINAYFRHYPTTLLHQ